MFEIMARKRNRQDMSGIFDRFFKKKETGQRSLFALPPASSQLPAPREEKRSLFSILSPKEQLPVRTEPRKPSPFSILAPSSPPAVEKPTPPPPSRPAVSFPKAEEEKGEVKDIFKGVLKKPATENPNRYVFIRPSAPPERIPIRPYGLPAPASTPVMEWTMPTPSQMAEQFKKMNLPAMWDEIRAIRQLPQFKQDQLANYWVGAPMMVPIDPVVYQEMYTDFANFYGIPWDVFATYLNVPPDRLKAAEEALWNNVLSPLNSMVPEAFEILKPPDLPGFFNVSFTEPGGEYWLYYIEPMFEGDVPPGGTFASY